LQDALLIDEAKAAARFARDVEVKSWSHARKSDPVTRKMIMNEMRSWWKWLEFEDIMTRQRSEALFTGDCFEHPTKGLVALKKREEILRSPRLQTRRHRAPATSYSSLQ
jgi:hypothetical protein